jgi:hypothetical protein
MDPMNPNDPNVSPPDLGELELESFFTKSQRTAFYVSFLCFLVSLVPAAGVLWFAGVIIGLATILLSFIGGIIDLFRHKGPHLLMSSLVLLLLLGIVGFGTCAINLRSL